MSDNNGRKSWAECKLGAETGVILETFSWKEFDNSIFSYPKSSLTDSDEFSGEKLLFISESVR